MNPFDLITTIYAYLASHTLTPIAVVLFIEEAGIPSPIPGDGLMLMGGIRSAQGEVSLLAVILVEELATLAGALLLFTVTRRFGRPAVVRFGRYVGLTDQRLSRAEGRFRNHDRSTIFVGRLVPGLRVPTVVAAGVLEVPFRRFFPAMAAGALLNLSTFTILGAVVGPPVLRVFSHLAFPMGAVWTLAALVGLTLLVREFRHSPVGKLLVRRSWAGAFLAGTIAVLVGVLVDNLLLDMVAFVGRLLSGRAMPPVRAVEQAYLLLRWPVFFAVAATLIAAGHLARVDRMGRLARFAIYALFPAMLLVVGSLLLAPAVPLHTLLTRQAVPLGAIGAIRWFAFGITLELLQGNEPSEATVEGTSA